MTSRKRSHEASIAVNNNAEYDKENHSTNTRNTINNSGSANGGNNATERKRRQIQQASWGLMEVLAECGLLEFVPSKSGNHDVTNDNNKSNNNNEGEQAGATERRSDLGCQLDPAVSPTTFRTSIHALLEEMSKNGIDPKNERVKTSLEEWISNSAEIEDATEGSEMEGRSSNALQLRKLLLPMYRIQSKTDHYYASGMMSQLSQSPMQLDDNDNDNEDKEGRSIKKNENIVVMESSSLIKVLLRIDILQPTLLTALLQKMPELAMANQDDDDGEGAHISNNNDRDGISGRRTNNGYNQDDIPRLIFSNIRWLDHLVNPNSLVNNFCEMLTVLSSSSSSCSKTRGILLDGIGCLPDVLNDCTSLVGGGYGSNAGDDEIDNDGTNDDEDENPILSTLQLLRIEDPTLLIPCLDAVGSLPLTEEQLMKVTQDALEALASVDVWGLPALTTFLMNNCPSGGGRGGIAREVIEEIRKLPLGNSINGGNNDNGEERPTNNKQQTVDTEALMIESLARGFTHRSDLTTALLKSIKETSPGHHPPADIWLLACCASAPHNRNQVKAVFKSKANNGGFSSRLLRESLSGNGVALNSLFTCSFCELADGLLRSSDGTSVELGVTLYELLFEEFNEPMQRQEIVGSLVTHVGGGVGVKAGEVDAAMRVFSCIIDGKKKKGRNDDEDGATTLRPFAPFLISLLDHLHHMTPTQVRRLFLLLFAVGDEDDEDNGGGVAGPMMRTSGRTGGGACDDVYIVIKKHLSLAPLAKKRIGIIGSVAYAVSRSSQLLEQQSSMENDERLANTEETCLDSNAAIASSPAVKDIKDMIENAYNHCKTSGMSCGGRINPNTSHASVGSAFSEGSAVAFMLDELCYAVRGGRLVEPIREFLNDMFQGEFEAAFVGDFEENAKGSKGTFEIDVGMSGALIPTSSVDLAFVNGTSTNTIAPQGEIRFFIDGSDVHVYVKILTLLSSYSNVERELLPVQLCPMFRLMATLNDMRYGGQGLSEIDAMLECPLLLPCAESSGIEFEELSPMKQWVVTSSYFFATCWVRELLNSFIYAAALVPSAGASPVGTASSSQGFNANDVRKKIIARLKSLVELEEELRFTSSKCFVFAPPGVDILPPPKELYDDAPPKKLESESVFLNIENVADMPINPTETTKEDKKASDTAKKIASKRAKLKEKSKQKRIKAKAKHEETLSARTMAALRPLDPHVCVALGFEEMSVMGADTSGGHLSQQLSQLQSIQVGGPVVTTLLALLENALTNLFSDHSKSAFKSRIGQPPGDSPDNGDSGGNPYLISTSSNNAKSFAEIALASCDNSSKKAFAVLDIYLTCGVFSSMYEHLAAVAELRCGPNRQNIAGNERHLVKTARCLFSCVHSLIGSEELTRSATGRFFLFSILKQLSEGDRDDYQNQKAIKLRPSRAIVNKLLVDLFDMIQEIIVGADTDDMDFVMDGISCLDAIFKCSQRVEKEATNVNETSNEVGEGPDCIPRKLSEISERLLRQSWPDDTKMNKTNVGKLLSLFLEHSLAPIPLHANLAVQIETENLGRMKTITLLVNDVLKELPYTERCKGPVALFPTCCYQSFGSYYSVALQYLQKELYYVFESSLGKTKDHNVAAKTMGSVAQLIDLLQTLFSLTQKNEVLAKKSFLLQQLKWGSRFMETFVSKTIPFFLIHFRHHEETILDVIRLLQKCARQLYHIISHGKREKDANLAKETPRAKKALELFTHKVKALLKKNNCMSAMFTKDMKSKEIDGTTRREDDGDFMSDDEGGTESDDDEEEDDGSDGSGSASCSENEYETDQD